MTAAQRVNIPAPTPAGLIIWCSDCGTSGELQVFNGSAWTNMIGSAANGLPVLSSTTAATSITSSSALSGGDVTSDGGSAVTERGICWNTSSNPTIAHSKFISTGTTGSFSGTLAGLTAQTIYYVRAYATNAYGISYGTQINFRTGDPSIGESFGGGTVAYILQSGDPGYDINVVHGIIAANIDQGSGNTWSNGNTTASHLSTGATSTALATGFTNTETIITIQGNTGSYAAKLCRDYRGGGYSDWYLPSKDELNKLYLNKSYPGMNSNYYWSSSENRTENAWVQSFGSGVQLDYWTKSTNSNAVRAVRSF
jgi:hypothetical protein